MKKIEEEKNKDINQALHHAANHGQHYAATLLLDRGAEVNGKTNYEWTPLQYATKCGHDELVTLIAKKGGKK